MTIGAAVCRVIGHARAREETGRIGLRKALASRCPRCKTIVGVRIVARAELRRMMFGRR